MTSSIHPKSASTILTWHFPLPRTHTGILIGNGTQGLMVWGETTLNITIARAGFWDHRGGNPFETRATFSAVRQLLEASDEKGIKELFAGASTVPSMPHFPQQIGGGRLEISLGKGWRPVEGKLDISRAILTIRFEGPAKKTARITIRQTMNEETAWLDFDILSAKLVTIKLIPSWAHVSKELEAVGCRPPAQWYGKQEGGFCQTLPEDDPMAIAWRKQGSRLVLATALGTEAAQQARQRVDGGIAPTSVKKTEAWWKSYWKDVPRLQLPDANLQHTYNYGVYKQAGLTNPNGVAATLQGPWMEEYQLPPWSNDYHFNINIQMIYWPCLGTNRLDHLAPIWRLLKSWMPRLTTNGEAFFGVKDAIMLPHAVDDRCQVVGTFWSGTIDHACTAWMAQLAWLHYRYSMDQAILRDIAWPLLNGAFNGYWAMLEEIEENGVKKLSLPVSVSPEYNGAQINAWGRDASFQMAALHSTATSLQEAAKLLGLNQDSRWADVRKRLPLYTLVNGRIGLWKGQDLAESHRHHSHLASIYPFSTIDPLADEHRAVVTHSLTHWTTKGAGCWTGWCLPWAAILCARCGLPDAATTWLQWWKSNFTNIGHGTLHDADFAGCEAWNQNILASPNFQRAPGFREIMQSDAGMGAVTAILELLVQCRHGGIFVLPGLPKHWRSLTFDGIRTEGAFLIGGTVRDGELCEIRVTSLAGEPLELIHGFKGAWTLNGKTQKGPRLSKRTKPGEKWVLSTKGR